MWGLHSGPATSFRGAAGGLSSRADNDPYHLRIPCVWGVVLVISLYYAAFISEVFRPGIPLIAGLRVPALPPPP